MSVPGEDVEGEKEGIKIMQKSFTILDQICLITQFIYLGILISKFLIVFRDFSRLMY